MAVLAIGDIVDTPYGPGVVVEIKDRNTPQSLTVSVSGTDYNVKQVGWIAKGNVNTEISWL